MSYRKLGSVPWKRRSDVRHKLLGLISSMDQMRVDMIHEELNADGALEEFDSWIASLKVIRRWLE